MRSALLAIPRLLRDVRARRDLLRTLVWRDLKAKYQASGLGYLWSLINPLVLLLIYTWVFSRVLRSGEEHHELFVASGLLPWIWTSEALAVGTGSIVGNARMVRRIHFPVELLPLATALAQFVHFLLSLPILLGFLWFFGRGPSLPIVLLPLIMAAHLCLTTGLVLTTATLNVRFRDLRYVVSHVLLILFFTAPIVYPLSRVPESYHTYVKLNPLTRIVTSYQDVLFYRRWPEAGDLLWMVGVSLVVFWVGAVVADRKRSSIAEDV
jgi:homopolymeric O-antigen transport system permease protein